jgi:ABC-type branched-subunit amino acid transport system ATPase component
VSQTITAPPIESAERPTKSVSANGLSEPSASALAAFNLQKSYGRRRVVDDVTLHVEPGEVVGLLGANGAGKTTTFYMIIGLETPEAGRVHLAAQDVTRLPMYLRARLGLGYLPQEPSVFRKMTAAENILAVLETMGLFCRNSVLNMCAIRAATRCPAVSAAARRSLGRSLLSRNLFSWTNLLPVSIPKPWTIFKASSSICVVAGLES